MNENQTCYIAAMGIFRMLRAEGVISVKEYHDLDTLMLRKYGLSLFSILSDNDLLSSPGRGNMQHHKEVALCQR